MSIVKGDGKAFSLNSVDLAIWYDDWPNVGYPSTLNLVGYFASGGAVMKTLEINTTPNSLMQSGNDYSRYALSGFDNLVQVDMFYQPYALLANRMLAMDNVSVTSATAPIPEPETYAMMLAGLGLLGVAARRRKQKSAT